MKQMTRTKQRARFLWWVCAAGMPFVISQAQALPSDMEAPIKIEADQLDVDDARGVSVYRGKVKFTQGTLELTADEVTLSATTDRALDKATARGKPATFTQQIDINGGIVTGRAERIEYNAKAEQMTLEGSAHLLYCGDEFQGSRIEYFVRQDLVKASKSGADTGRVQVILQPRKRQDGAAQSPCRKLTAKP